MNRSGKTHLMWVSLCYASQLNEKGKMSWVSAVIAIQSHTASWLLMLCHWLLHAPALMSSFLWQIVPPKGREREQEKGDEDGAAELWFLNIHQPDLSDT